MFLITIVFFITHKWIIIVNWRFHFTADTMTFVMVILLAMILRTRSSRKWSLLVDSRVICMIIITLLDFPIGIQRKQWWSRLWITSVIALCTRITVIHHIITWITTLIRWLFAFSFDSILNLILKYNPWCVFQKFIDASSRNRIPCIHDNRQATLKQITLVYD